MKQGRMQEAAEALAWLRHSDLEDPSIKAEMLEIRAEAIFGNSRFRHIGDTLVYSSHAIHPCFVLYHVRTRNSRREVAAPGRGRPRTGSETTDRTVRSTV